MDRTEYLKKYWAPPLLCLAVIYATIPAGRPIVNLLRERNWIDPLMNVFCFFSLSVFAGIAFHKFWPRRPLRKALFFASVAVYAAAVWQGGYPEEKIHFFEYSLLTFLLYRVFLVHMEKAHAYAASLAGAFAAGWFDEFLQHLHPERYYSFQDVLVNLAGAAFGIIFIAVLDDRPSAAASARSGPGFPRV